MNRLYQLLEKQLRFGRLSYLQGDGETARAFRSIMSKCVGSQCPSG